MPSSTLKSAFIEQHRLELNSQPTELRRCLSCDEWMRSTGPDHRICNLCKGGCLNQKRGPGSQVKTC